MAVPAGPAPPPGRNVDGFAPSPPAWRSGSPHAGNPRARVFAPRAARPAPSPAPRAMQLLTPDTQPNALPLPQTSSDIAREASEVLTLDGPLNIPPKAITVLRVKTGHFTLNVSINTVRKANRLVVTFMGA